MKPAAPWSKSHDPALGRAMTEALLSGRVVLHAGDCRSVLVGLEPDSIDACVTDPPYHLTSVVATTRSAFPGRYAGTEGASRGFMGKQWDGGNVAFDPDTWRAVARVLKPGAHLIAMGGTRTYHRLACAIEDAGFEIRDTISWLYGSGFPKSHDVSKGIDRAAGMEREKIGPKVYAGGHIQNHSGGKQGYHEWSGVGVYEADGPAITDAARQWAGWGTALKPACELIVLARKPLSESTVAANVLRWGTGAINVDGCRVGTESTIVARKQIGAVMGTNGVYGLSAGRQDTGSENGRWPANVAHDGSDEVVAALPDSVSVSTASVNGCRKGTTFGGSDAGKDVPGTWYGDTGSAARFFYTAKADADDRLGSKHPTVKPLDLMQWLVRLVTPKGGTVLDPFAGTGTTGEAAWREGMRAVLIEAEAEYQADIRRRMALALAGPDERSRESVKAKGLPYDPGPLFTDEWRKMWAKPFDFSKEPKGNPG